MTIRDQRVRAIAGACVLVLLLSGGLWGDDDHFPFGPMRMYSTTNAPSGRVRVIRFEGVTEDGRTIPISTASFGMRPAEIDGQMDRLRGDPELLRHLVTAYERISGRQPRLDELRLILGIHNLRERRSVSYSEVVVAGWSRP
ncbi:MAG: hypothetical protein ACRDJV_08325 [Actinomycetota bacterium]